MDKKLLKILVDQNILKSSWQNIRHNIGGSPPLVKLLVGYNAPFMDLGSKSMIQIPGIWGSGGTLWYQKLFCMNHYTE